MSLHLHQEFVRLKTLFLYGIYGYPSELLQVIKTEPPVLVPIHHKEHPQVTHVESVLLYKTHAIHHIAEYQEVFLSVRLMPI